jgi:hypothetical protein
MSPSGWEQNAIYLQSGDPERENTPTLMEPGLLGSRFTVMNPTGKQAGAAPSRSKRYQLVKTDSTMAVGPYPGATAYWADKAQYLVTTVNTNLNAVAGVFMGLIDKGNYGCVQIGGPGYVKVLDADTAAAAVGDSIIGSATAGKATRIAAGTAPTNVPLGRVSTPLAKLASEARVLVDLDVPETP